MTRAAQGSLEVDLAAALAKPCSLDKAIARLLADAGLAEFVRMLEYKCA
jgi:transposase